LDHLAFLPAGDAALTRRATKASGLSAVVVRWSRSRKRYERQGVLVEDHALTVAEKQCLSDADARARRRERDQVRCASVAPRRRPPAGAACYRPGPHGLAPAQPPHLASGLARQPYFVDLIMVRLLARAGGGSMDN
jgi:hypothetical protein